VLGQNQTFDAKLDRSICPVPWFHDALEGKDAREIPSKLRELQNVLSQALDRPTMALTNGVDNECYYSKSEVGSQKLLQYFGVIHSTIGDRTESYK
jgi:hypothetical protein